MGVFSNGQHYLAIPGPSVIPERVLNAMHRLSPNIYEGPLIDLTHQLLHDLKSIAQTQQHLAMYLCNGHGVWEAALANIIAPGTRLLVPTTGAFGINWAAMVAPLGGTAEMMDFGRQEGIDYDALETRLRKDQAHEITGILFTHVDTSTSILNDIQKMRAVLNAARHPALLVVDAIASFACEPIEMDAWGIDLLITASQKGLMCPPGVGLLYISEKAVKRRKELDRVSPYWDFLPRLTPEIYAMHFFGTAPTHLLHGLHEATLMLQEEGMAQVYARHQGLAEVVWAACARWALAGDLHFNVNKPQLRSHAVTTLRIGDKQAAALRIDIAKQYGITLGIGLGMDSPDDPLSHSHLRIGHMGHVNAQMVLAALAALDTGLKAHNIAHGAGALEAATQMLATLSHTKAQ